MSEQRRCPNCGGLVGAEAEWCTQCFARLDTGPATQSSVPAPAPPASAGETSAATAPVAAAAGSTTTAQAADRVVRAVGDNIVWDCPVCGTENPIESFTCSACSTPFRRVLEDQPEKIDMDPGRAAMLSLFFPGIGHFVVGRKGEAFARGVMFAFAFITGLVSLTAFRSGSSRSYLYLMVLAFGSAAALYVISTLDAARAAERQPPLLPARVLMYGGIGLIVVTLAVVTITAAGARG